MSLIRYIYDLYVVHRIREMSKPHRYMTDQALKRNVITFLRERADDSPEIQEILTYIQNYPLYVFPYPFMNEYDPMDIPRLRDSNRRPYIDHNGKKLYFPASDRPHHIVMYYNGLRKEQDHRSPHWYGFAPNCAPKEGDVIADIGAAEAIWALDNIEICSKAYIFECDKQWIDALERTFAPWRDKVEIVQKFVGDIDSEQKNMITLDTFFADKRIDCIKADIEGAEPNMLIGGAATMRDKIQRAVICAYHSNTDEAEIKDLLRRYGLSNIYTSSGYMLFPTEPPYLRRGLVAVTR